MKRGIKYIVLGFLVALTVGATGVLGLYPRFFDITWDEEVALHDGRVIVVKMRQTYEWKGWALSLDRHDPSIFQQASLTFDAGPKNGVITQLFVHQRPMLLDTSEGEWFVVLQGRAGNDVQSWGDAQNGNGQRTARLIGDSFKSTPINQLPVWMSTANLLMDYAPKKELAKLNGTKLTLAQKSEYLQKYPLGPIDMRIERPQPSTSTSK